MASSPESVSSGPSEHEGLVVSDGRHKFRIVAGRRCWLDTPPLSLRLEIQQQERDAASGAPSSI